MTDGIILNRINIELFAANIQKNQLIKCNKIQYGSQDARVLIMKDIKDQK